MDNLEEMDKFLLKRYNLQRLNQEEIENRNISITSNGIETEMENLPTNKSPRPGDFIGKFYRAFREELTTVLFILVQKCEEEGTLPSSFYELGTITLVPKPDEELKEKI